MNEKQFLELSDRERNGWVAEKVFAHKEDRGIYYYDAERGEYVIPDYTTTWQGMGKGIEHAKENESHIEFHISKKFGTVIVAKNGRACFSTLSVAGNIFLAFWIAYMKALGVLE